MSAENGLINQGVPFPPVEEPKPTEVLSAHHHLYLDRWKVRQVHLIAPLVMTAAEMERLKGWLATILIVEEGAAGVLSS